MDPELDFHEQGEDFLSGINLTPFVDIIFNLLIFFMLTATLALPEALEVDLPSARAPQQQAPTELVITIDARGIVRIAGKAILEDPFETIVSLVRRENPQIATVLTDRKAPVQALITVMDALRAAGQTKVSVATVAESERSSS